MIVKDPLWYARKWEHCHPKCKWEVLCHYGMGKLQHRPRASKVGVFHDHEIKTAVKHSQKNVWENFKTEYS